MLFRRIIFASIFVGLVAGICLSLAQVSLVNPIIFAAEAFEYEPLHDHSSHDHGADEWAPEQGAERTGYSLLANVLAGVGFAAIVLAFMAQLRVAGLGKITVLHGSLWGLAGFVAFFVAPAVGLPPEIPGIEAAPIEHRQTWWLLTVSCVSVGLLVLAYAPVKLKVLGILMMLPPYIITIPHIEGPMFLHPEAEVVAKLSLLHREFILASASTNLLFWVVLGLMSAWVLNAWVLREAQTEVNHVNA